MKELAIVYLIWNILVILIYAFDKSRAVRGERRIRERTLIILAFAFGGIGAVLGMILFNHKTSKIKFRILVPLAYILNMAVCIFVFLTGR